MNLKIPVGNKQFSVSIIASRWNPKFEQTIQEWKCVGALNMYLIWIIFQVVLSNLEISNNSVIWIGLGVRRYVKLPRWLLVD